MSEWKQAFWQGELHVADQHCIMDSLYKIQDDFGKSKNQLKVRNAKIGGYKSELSEDDILFCNNEMEKLNSYFNYQIW